MADLSRSVLLSPDQLAVGGGAAGKETPSSVLSRNGSWEAAESLDQITVVRIDDTHIAEEQSHGGKFKDGAPGFYEVVEYSREAVEYSREAEEVEVMLDEEDDGVYVIEYSNPEEEGESYQFTMAVDKTLQSKKPAARGDAAAPLPAAWKPPSSTARQKRKLEGGEEVISNKSVLELGESYSEVMETNSGSGKKLMCSLCPPPGRSFKSGSGLAVHLKQMHHMKTKKTYFCTTCKQTCRTQIDLDGHTKRHANKEAVFTCSLCAAEAGPGYTGTRWGLKSHLGKVHPGVIPRCHVCSKNFKTLATYLGDQFRHVGKSPYYCARCQIYEMTERGLSIHIRNHDKKRKRPPPPQEAGQTQPLTPDVPAVADVSATDDSDF